MNFTSITEFGQEFFESRQQWAHKKNNFPLWGRLEYYLKFSHWDVEQASLLLKGIIPEICESGIGRFYETYWGEETFTDEGKKTLESAIDIEKLYRASPDAEYLMPPVKWVRWAHSKGYQVLWLDMALEKMLIKSPIEFETAQDRREAAIKYIKDFKVKGYPDFNKRTAEILDISVSRLKQIIEPKEILPDSYQKPDRRNK